MVNIVIKRKGYGLESMQMEFYNIAGNAIIFTSRYQ